MEIKKGIYLVFGAGKSGIASAALLKNHGADVVLYDGNQALDTEGTAAKLAERTPLADEIKIIAGELPEEIKADIVCAVLSPGIPTDLPLVEEFRNSGAEISGEVEIAYRLGKGRVYAVTGTNGKTTTTTLLGELMKAVHEKVDVVGNIGDPYADIADAQTDESVTVIEISSFQLETIKEFHPRAAVITNITEDHMNRHHTMENYIQCKKDVVKNQDENDCCILNYEDEVLRKFAEEVRSKVVFFSSVHELEEGFYLKDGSIVFNDGTGVKEIIKTDDLQIVGLHNYENVMAAAAAAVFDGMPVDEIRKVLAAFKGVEHRIEYVGEFDGVKYYNDSKGTNPAAAIHGIAAMKGPAFLIAGGYDKQSSYEEWIDTFGDKVFRFVLIGQTKEKIAAAAANCGFPADRIVMCEDLKEAVEYCRKNAQPGSEVLLSPACASWDQFKSYEQRGEMFKEFVREGR